jgi:uncharacterized DUF497 family protein
MRPREVEVGAQAGRPPAACRPFRPKANRAKHGVSFEEAKSALTDPGRVSRLDLDHADIEERFLTVGYSSRGRLLAVVTAEQPQGIIRIISARRATKRERHAYETGSF